MTCVCTQACFMQPFLEMLCQLPRSAPAVLMEDILQYVHVTCMAPCSGDVESDAKRSNGEAAPITKASCRCRTALLLVAST